MIERIPSHTRQIVIEQNQSRKHWREGDTPQIIDNMLLEEQAEMLEAVELAQIGESASALASELGDMGYLFVKRFQFEEPPSLEVMGAYYRTLEIADLAGIDLGEAVLMKCLRNDMKYMHMVSNNGYIPAEARRFSKDFWRELGGDSAFSHAYLMLASTFLDMEAHEGEIQTNIRGGEMVTIYDSNHRHSQRSVQQTNS